MPANIHGYLGVLRKQGIVGSLFPIRTPLCSIGRGSDCNVRIHQRYISNKHCVITSHNDMESTIESLSPNCATLVNETNLEDNVAILHHGDIITMGERKFVWQYPESSKFWSNHERKSLKIAPTEVPGVMLKRAASQGKLSSPQILPDRDQIKTSKNKHDVKQSRAVSASFILKSNKTPERKTSSFQTLAPKMLASLQKRVSEMGFGELGTLSKAPNTVYGHLVVLRPNGAVGSSSPLSTDKCLIGRGLNCSIKVPIATISEQQCLISSQKDQQSTITNLSKTSNTYLNGKTLAEEAIKLCHGDIISMAERYFRWEYPKSSQFCKKLPSSGVVNSRLTKQYGKTNLAMSQNPSLALDSHKNATLSKSGSIKTSVTASPSNMPRKTSKSSSTTVTKGPLKYVVPNSLLSHLDPENTSRVSLRSLPTLKGTEKRSQPYPFLKSTPESRKSYVTPSKNVARKVSSFNNPTSNNKTSQTRKLRDRKNTRESVPEPGSLRLKKSASSYTRPSPQQMTNTDSSCDEMLFPPPPAEGTNVGVSRTLSKISPTLFEGFCSNPITQTKLQNKQVTEFQSSPDSSVPTSARYMQENKDDEVRSIAGLIDPLYCDTDAQYRATDAQYRVTDALGWSHSDALYCDTDDNDLPTLSLQHSIGLLHNEN